MSNASISKHGHSDCNKGIILIAAAVIVAYHVCRAARLASR
jgi:hypothetical protein